jgi:hypothetical protein
MNTSAKYGKENLGVPLCEFLICAVGKEVIYLSGGGGTSPTWCVLILQKCQWNSVRPVTMTCRIGVRMKGVLLLSLQQNSFQLIVQRLGFSLLIGHVHLRLRISSAPLAVVLASLYYALRHILIKTVVIIKGGGVRMHLYCVSSALV